MAHTCVWASLCVNPQRYFNFCWILKKRAVAAALGLPAGEFRGALWPWLRGGDEGEVAHGQGPCRTHWRLFLEDFRTTTLLHQNPANPNHSLQHPSTSLSLSLSRPLWALFKAIFLSNFNFSEHLFMQFSSNALCFKLPANPMLQSKIACAIVKLLDNNLYQYHTYIAINNKINFTFITSSLDCLLWLEHIQPFIFDVHILLIS